jgi:hypothetical protein
VEFRSLLFVSKSLIPIEDERREIDRILSVGKIRNANLGITGSLILTHQYFAAVLEGRPSALEELLELIRRDPRHRDLKVVDVFPILRPAHSRLSMAYHGPSAYVSRRVTRLFEGANQDAARELRTFMLEMSQPL